MASIRIHQDIYNFERKRNGLTSKQWLSIGMAVAAAVAMSALCIYALRIRPEFSLVLALIVATPFILAGFMPVQRMSAERYFEKITEMDERGNAITWKGEEAPARESELTNDYKKACKRKGFECSRHEALEESRKKVEQASEGIEWRRTEWILP